MAKKTALIAGASGLVGKEVLHLLLESKDYHKIYAIVRRPLGTKHPKLVEVVCDFDNLEEEKDCFAVNDVYCCLGTTIKKAKSKQQMYKVDVEYPLMIAQLAFENKAEHFLLVSSMNANEKSSIWYSKMKGELESKLQTIPFHKISILRPSLLLGDRKEFRFGETLASILFKMVSIFLKDSWKNQLGIEAKIVAKAMYTLAQSEKQGLHIYNVRDIANLTRE